MKMLVKLVHYIITVLLIFMIIMMVTVTFDLMTGKNQEASGAWVLSMIFAVALIWILIYERKFMKKMMTRFDNKVKEKDLYSYAFDPDQAVPVPSTKADNSSTKNNEQKTAEMLKDQANIIKPDVSEKVIPDMAVVDTMTILETESKSDPIEDSGEGVHNSIVAEADIIGEEKTAAEETCNKASESVKAEDNVPKVLKGIKGELSVNEKCVRVRNSVIPLLNIDEIVYKGGTTFSYGFVTFCTGSGVGEGITKWTEADKNGNSIVFKADQNEVLKEILDQIEEYVDYRITISDATYLGKTPLSSSQAYSYGGSYSDAAQKRSTVTFGGITCPRCHGANIQLLDNTKNLNEFGRVGMNLNPAHPLTFFKVKKVKKEKLSAAKLGLGLATGGTSLVLTGVKKKKHNEYHCRDCGKRWIGK